MALTLDWEKGQNSKWDRLLSSNFDQPAGADNEGVFIVWHGGASPEIVCVGKGKIQERLKTLSEDTGVKAFQSLNLYFTWAKVVAEQQEGVEAFLLRTLAPKIGSPVGPSEPISVNMPWRK